jgi:hypothetical protein
MTVLAGERKRGSAPQPTQEHRAVGTVKPSALAVSG